MSGGHAHCRGVVDYLQADNLSRGIKNVIDINYPRLMADLPLIKFFFVDIGSKFSKIARVLTDRVQIKFEDLIGNLKEGVLP